MSIAVQSKVNIVRLWPIATDDALTANRRFRGIADMKRFSAPDDLSRMTQRRHLAMHAALDDQSKPEPEMAVHPDDWICASRRWGSVCLDARELDYLGPFLGVVGYEFPELGGRSGRRS